MQRPVRPAAFGEQLEREIGGAGAARGLEPALGEVLEAEGERAIGKGWHGALYSSKPRDSGRPCEPVRSLRRWGPDGVSMPSRVTPKSLKRSGGKAALPRWIEPQLCTLVAAAPNGAGWAHEIKYDGYRIAARIDRGAVQLLTRKGLDWTAKYPETAQTLARLPVTAAYLDGELCGVDEKGVTSFALMQNAGESSADLVYYAFDLLHLDGVDPAALALGERKARLAKLLQKPTAGIAYSSHEAGDGEALCQAACKHGLEGIVSKQIDRPYAAGNRGQWVKSKCLNEAEFVIVGWSDPEGSRTLIGALLLGYYTDAASSSMPAGLAPAYRSRHSRCCMADWCRWRPRSCRSTPSRRARFATARRSSYRACTGCGRNSAQATYLTFTEDGLLQHTVFLGLREDKPAREMRREAVAPERSTRK